MNTIINTIKKYTFISIFIMIILTNAITDFPLQDYLSSYISYQASLMISIFIKQMGCFLVLLYLALKLKISDTFNLKLSKPVRDLVLIIPLLMICAINITDIKISDLPNDKLILVLYFFAFLSTGFFEEILFRGVIFNLILDKYGKSRHMFLFSVIISNLIFGASHITNLLNGTVPLINFLNQLMYATIIGILFTALYLRCNTLLIPIILHGLIDITGCIEFLAITSKELQFQARVQQAVSIDTIISNLILFIPLLIWALFLLRKVKFNEKVDSSKTFEKF